MSNSRFYILWFISSHHSNIMKQSIRTACLIICLTTSMPYGKSVSWSVYWSFPCACLMGGLSVFCSDEGLTLETSTLKHFTMIIYIINSVNKTKLSCYTPPLSQNHSFFRNLPPLGKYIDMHIYSKQIAKQTIRKSVWRTAGRQADRQTGRQTGRQTYRQTNRQRDRHTDRQTDRQVI